MYKSMVVLKNRMNGKYVALDSASGGYPYDVPTPDKAKDWSHEGEQEIQHYTKMFPEYYPVDIKLHWEENEH